MNDGSQRLYEPNGDQEYDMLQLVVIACPSIKSAGMAGSGLGDTITSLSLCSAVVLVISISIKVLIRLLRSIHLDNMNTQL